jgi:rhodanese-related sulfurtransferase
VVADAAGFATMRTELIRIGYDNILGYLAGGIQAWINAGRPVHRLTQINAHELAERLKGGQPLRLVDVRTPQEWAAGRIPGAEHQPFTEILAACCTLPTDEEIVVYCGSGYRSNMAGSFLRQHGYANVKSLAGGILAWTRSGRLLTQESSAPSATI